MIVTMNDEIKTKRPSCDCVKTFILYTVGKQTFFLERKLFIIIYIVLW